MLIIKPNNISNLEILIDDEDFDLISKYNWYVYKPHKSTTYYSRATHTIKENKNAKIYIHRLILGVTDPSIFVDHIDGNGLNNQKLNLRICSQSENMRNMKKPISNKSGFKGVFYRKDRNTYAAAIVVKGKKHHLGHFKNKLDAANAYNQAAIKYFGEFAKLNVIKENKNE